MWELKAAHAKMRAKVLAPAATKTEFGKVANDVREYDYDEWFSTYHTSTQMAAFLLELNVMQALKLQYEQGKLERKVKSREQKEAEKERQFILQQEKKKAKHRGK